MTSLRFGRLEWFPTQRRLLVDGEAAEIGARAFDLLSTLIAHRDRIVGKDELLHRVWQGVVVEENNLTVQVAALRKVVGAKAIATVPGRGYRWAAPLSEPEAAPPAPEPEPAEPPAPVPVGDLPPAAPGETDLGPLDAGRLSFAARDAAGRDALSFTLSVPRTLSVEALSLEAPQSLRLIGPDGALLAEGTAPPRVFARLSAALEPGRYRLEIDRPGDAPAGRIVTLQSQP